MKLILTQDVPNLGSLGDIVEVKPGYGRNYLVPRGMALLANSKKSKELQHRVQYLQKLREGEISQAQEKAEAIKALTLEATRKAGPGGRLFGSVTSRDIIQLLEDAGYSFERRAVTLNTPIRDVGTHTFTLRVHTEVKIEANLKVIGEFEAPPAPEVVAAESADASEEESAEEQPEEAADSGEATAA